MGGFCFLGVCVFCSRWWWWGRAVSRERGRPSATGGEGVAGSKGARPPSLESALGVVGRAPAPSAGGARAALGSPAPVLRPRDDRVRGGVVDEVVAAGSGGNVDWEGRCERGPGRDGRVGERASDDSSSSKRSRPPQARPKKLTSWSGMAAAGWPRPRPRRWPRSRSRGASTSRLLDVFDGGGGGVPSLTPRLCSLSRALW